MRGFSRTTFEQRAPLMCAWVQRALSFHVNGSYFPSLSSASLVPSHPARHLTQPTSFGYIYLEKEFPFTPRGWSSLPGVAFIPSLEKGQGGGTRGRVPKAVPGPQSCPCTMWGETPQSGQCWAESASVAVKGEEPQVLWL